VLSRDGYLERWAVLHGGYDPRGNVLVRRWLALTYVVARPLVRVGAAPDPVTFLAVVVSASAAAVAPAGDRWFLLAALLVVVSGLLDSVDGAVAVLADRATRWGHVLDSVADRVSDTAYLVALWAAGAPGPLCVAGGVLMFLQEYTRARAGSAGMTEVGVVTVWERPTRVIVTAAFLLSAGVFRDEVWSGLGAAAWVALGAVGLVQLTIVVRRRLGQV
jgi:phosphatidylglycerophosphate synthase